MKSKNVQLRKATLEDAGALVQCIDSAYAKYPNRIPDMPLVSSGIAEEITQNQVWVAVEEGEIVAGLFLVPKDGFMKLANLAVHPNHGGKGIGRKLTELSESEARRQGYNEMRLNTHVAMPENVQLYEHLGWEVAARNNNTVSMRKCLQDA
ncbi:MAG: GNAT family N-acetyltransferase [Roseovarius sp.]|nr:GNAT family N-acetyltransferase [Roseovarius sp.]